MRAASTRTSLKYDVLDFTFGRSFCISKTLIFRPFWGIRGLWLNQSQQAVYLREPLADSDLNETDFDTFKLQNKGETSGVGGVIGLDASIHLCQGFSLFGSGEASLLAAKSRFRNRQQAIFKDSDSLSTVNLKEKQNVPLATYHIAFGLNWETSICNNCSVFHIGYEFTHLIPTVKTRRYPIGFNFAASTGAFTQSTMLHGLRVGATAWF